MLCFSHHFLGAVMILCLLSASHFTYGVNKTMERFEMRENDTTFIPISAAHNNHNGPSSSSSSSSSKDESDESSSSSWKQKRVLNASDHEVPSGPNPVSN